MMHLPLSVPNNGDAGVYLRSVVYIIIGIILHIGISEAYGKLCSPMLGQGKLIPVAQSGSCQRTSGVLITAVIPFQVIPSHMGMQAEEMAFAGFLPIHQRSSGWIAAMRNALSGFASHKLHITGISTVMRECTCTS